ncbi:hypothetical protein ACHAWF_012239 [Thalassiosira exigua]
MTAIFPISRTTPSSTLHLTLHYEHNFLLAMGDSATTPACVLDRSVLNDQHGLVPGQPRPCGLREVVQHEPRGIRLGHPRQHDLRVRDDNEQRRDSLPPLIPKRRHCCCLMCTSFPTSFSANAIFSFPIPDSANLTQSFPAGNVTAEATVKLVDFFVRAVYHSSLPGATENLYTCNVNDLAMLANCATSDIEKKSLLSGREAVWAVTLAGAFVPASWAMEGRTLLMEEVKEFYASKDFCEMASLGILDRASRVGLSAILALVAPEDAEDVNEETVEDHMESAAAFTIASSTVVALQLPPSSFVFGRHLMVLVPTNKGQLQILPLPPGVNLYGALDVGASTSVVDVMLSPQLARLLPDPHVYVTSGFFITVYKDEEDFQYYD